VTQTAKALGLTQSAVSHRMREAERRADAVLFRRDGRRVTLTRAGRRLALAARVILAEAARAEADLEQMSRGIESMIRLGGACYATFPWFWRFHTELRDKYPSFGAEIIAEVMEDPLLLLKNNTADVVLLVEGADDMAVRYIPLCQDRLVAVMAPGHPLAASARIKPAAFTHHPYVTYHTTPERGLEYERIFADVGRLPPQVLSAGRVDAVTALVATGQALSIQPWRTVAPAVAQGWLVARPLAAPDAITWQAAVKANEPNSSPAVLAAGLIQGLLAVE
jgi:LysR family transcriptional regulator for metE and metH